MISGEEYACPFCSDYFDIVSLCCHIDEDHPMDTINEVCPVYAVKVSSDMVAYITLFEGSSRVMSSTSSSNITADPCRGRIPRIPPLRDRCNEKKNFVKSRRNPKQAFKANL